MGHGVFIHRYDSRYADTPAIRYQFPAQYLRRAEACVGDWILYYEPVKVRDSRGYFAAAKVQSVIPDPEIANMYFALIEPGEYLEFDNPVSFKLNGAVVEQGLLNEAGQISGRAQAAMRPLATADFNRIINLAIGGSEVLLPREGESESVANAVREPRHSFAFDEPVERRAIFHSRPERDRLFRSAVLKAYGERCAMTGLRLINGGGRAEAEAAHIKPVSAGGPDAISNGIALSGTVHWMFDRGLLSLDDELNILISRQANDRESIATLINKDRRAFSPAAPMHRPHPAFLQWHRDHVFKH